MVMSLGCPFSKYDVLQLFWSVVAGVVIILVESGPIFTATLK